jgi:SAM-dependent methyltransferase
MKPAERWLAATWPLVRAGLPAAPALVVDVGCGPLGGFVPMLRSSGYDAVGVDPQAPEGTEFEQTDFERAGLPRHVDAFVASTSLHHVSDPARVLDRITSALTKGGRLVVVEWAWETFDEQTAAWCFERLGPADEGSWLEHRRHEWLASGEDWSSNLRAWAEREELHTGETLVHLLDERFDRHLLTHGPYFFPDLPSTTEADEQAAINAGEIRATRINWLGALH